jgi:hypothetical protein
MDGVSFLILMVGPEATLATGAPGAVATPPPSQAAYTLCAMSEPTSVWNMNTFYWAGNVGSVSIVNGDPDLANGPNVLQLVGSPGTYTAVVAGNEASDATAWSVAPAGPCDSGPLEGGVLPAEFSAPNGELIGFPPPQQVGEASSGYSGTSTDTNFDVMAVRGEWNGPTITAFKDLVIAGPPPAAQVTVQEMFTAIWNLCATNNNPDNPGGQAWAKSMGATLLAWMFSYPFAKPQSSWFGDLNSLVYGTVYVPFIIEDKPGWGQGDPPLPPPPNVR